jgi:hypothetical protein
MVLEVWFWEGGIQGLLETTNIAGSLEVSLVPSNVFAVSHNFIYLFTYNSLCSMQSYTFRGSNQNLS